MALSITARRGAYAHSDYAATLAEFGTPRQLSASGGSVLERRIGDDRQARDAMGCYPIFSCTEWNALPDDLEVLQRDLVSLVLVSDPMAPVAPEWLSRCFVDLVRPFKDHFVADLSRTPEHFVDAHHRRNARSALRTVEVETNERPYAWAGEWTRLYEELIRHHAITGMRTFSERALSAQLYLPGAVALRALYKGATVAMLVWYVDDEVAYYHLGASSPQGYALKASFGLFWESLRYLAARGVAWVDFGGAAGATFRADDGLARFKRGWSTDTRTAYLCGRVFDAVAYDNLADARGIRARDYFPAYRTGEFV